jgi:TIR domain-containing protein
MDAPGFPYDYFISRRGSVAALAREAAAVLEAAGHRVRVQDHDFTAAGNFVRDIDDALKQCRYLLIPYSADYHDSFWTRQEFHNFFAAVAVSDGQRRIGALRLRDADRPAARPDLAALTGPAAGAHPSNAPSHRPSLQRLQWLNRSCYPKLEPGSAIPDKFDSPPAIAGS